MYHPTSSVNSDSNNIELRQSSFINPTYQPTSSSNNNGAVVLRPFAPTALVAPVLLARNREEEGKKEDNTWMKYADPSPELFVRGNFFCLWKENLRDGTSQPCGYYSRKLALKRHIESRHLKLRCASAQPDILLSSLNICALVSSNARPYECWHCGKGFSQQCNFDTHLNTQ